MGDAMMDRALIARLETLLRHHRRNTRKQRSKKRDIFKVVIFMLCLRLNSPRRADENASQSSMFLI
jgi:hypothetical protein